MSTERKTRKATPTALSGHTMPASTSIVTSRAEKFFVRFALLVELCCTILVSLRNPLKVRPALRLLKAKYQSVFGMNLMTKVAKAGGRYYWRFATPGFPSKAGRILRANELNRVIPFKRGEGLGLVLLGLTKKCGLSCDHCYEWDRMHAPDVLSLPDLITIVHQYQAYGATQFMFGGGEPLLRFEDLCTILKSSYPGTDFWIATSGWKLDHKKAQRLKASGLTGVMVSLDSHIEEDHDIFRGKKGAFKMAITAVHNAKAANLVVGLAVCPTKTYATIDNLHAYMHLARDLGVTYVQIFEPRPIGRFKEKAVVLSKDQIALLEYVYLNYNTRKQYRDYPIVNYTGYHQRRYGCFGAGNYFFYIDTNGSAHPCPFCNQIICNVLENTAAETIEQLRKHSSCQSFLNEGKPAVTSHTG